MGYRRAPSRTDVIKKGRNQPPQQTLINGNAFNSRVDFSQNIEKWSIIEKKGDNLDPCVVSEVVTMRHHRNPLNFPAEVVHTPL
ncbi:unnamed protein product [Rodentolepis nana]|uniref:Uncharacterized protein n=1 Tax=Rodentolepis nana TaxID=102285 RepID=A0A0R3U093_RODNA|nr:unnamed protein product [Rodentolepis nana]